MQPRGPDGSQDALRRRREGCSEPFPILHVDDVERSSRFYAESFGFEEEYRFPDDGPPEFAFLKMGETGIGIGGKGAPPLPDWPQNRPVGSFQLCI